MNKPDASHWTGSPWFLRVLAILAVFITTMECVGSLYFLWDTWAHFRSGDPGYQGWLLAPPVCIWVLMMFAAFTLFPRLTRGCWVLMYSYRIAGEVLEARDIVPRQRWAIRLDDVVRIRPFFLGGPRQANAAFGWVLEAASGAGIPACEALPIWPEIARRCAHAEIVPLPEEPLDQCGSSGEDHCRAGGNKGLYVQFQWVIAR